MAGLLRESRDAIVKLSDLQGIDLPGDTELGIDLGDGALHEVRGHESFPSAGKNPHLLVFHAGQEITLDADYEREAGVKSVLQDWVMELPLRHQGVLIAGLRGCDIAPKNPKDSPERQLVAWLRWGVLNPADAREIDIPGAFMQSKAPEIKGSEFGHYPEHWYAHAMHAAQVVAYCHPDWDVRVDALTIYETMVKNLHLRPESKEDMDERLTEDRILNDNVVS
jgi:hypothetical protein